MEGEKYMNAEEEQKKTLARNIQHYCNIKNLPLYKIAEGIGIPYTTFLDIYHGRKMPRMNRVEKIAKYFDIEISDLINYETRKPEYSLCSEEKTIIELYRNADSSTKDVIKRLLDYVDEV